MSDEFEILAPQVRLPSETVVAPLEHGPLPGVIQEMPRAEQVQATEAYFTRENDEAHQVAGVLGLWAGTLLLHDLAIEHFEGREEPRTRPRRRPGRSPEEEQ